MKVIIGCDHSAVGLKNAVTAYLQDRGYQLKDIGTYTTESVDYPDYARQVGLGVASGEFDRGIMVDGVGSASAVVCNKIPGVRAAVVFNEFSATIMREHGNSNVMCIGARVLDPQTAGPLARLWLETGFLIKYAARVAKIAAVESEFSRPVRTGSKPAAGSLIVNERELLKRCGDGIEIVLPSHAILTPAARDLVRTKKLNVRRLG